jgi:hypothetical protein
LGEPFVFGVPDGQDREFFLETGLELGETLKIGSPESVRRYAMRQDGSYYGAHLEKVFQQRREVALKGHGRCGSPASRRGHCYVGLLAGRVGRPLAPFLLRYRRALIAPAKAPVSFGLIGGDALSSSAVTNAWQ